MQRWESRQESQSQRFGISPLELIKNGAIFSTAGVLEKGQTQELIEARKLEKGELDLLEKVIEIVSKSKK